MTSEGGENNVIFGVIMVVRRREVQFHFKLIRMLFRAFLSHQASLCTLAMTQE